MFFAKFQRQQRSFVAREAGPAQRWAPRQERKTKPSEGRAWETPPHSEPPPPRPRRPGPGGRQGAGRRTSLGPAAQTPPAPAASGPPRAGGKRRGAPRGHLPPPPRPTAPRAHCPAGQRLGRRPRRGPRAPPPERRRPAALLESRGPGAGWRNPGAGARARTPRLTFLGGVHLVWRGGGDAAARLPRRRPEPSVWGGEGGEERGESGAGPGRCVCSGASEEARGRSVGERERERERLTESGREREGEGLGGPRGEAWAGRRPEGAGPRPSTGTVTSGGGPGAKGAGTGRARVPDQGRGYLGLVPRVVRGRGAVTRRELNSGGPCGGDREREGGERRGPSLGRLRIPGFGPAAVAGWLSFHL